MISLYCLEFGLKVPVKLIEAQHLCCFLQSAAAFPFAGPVPSTVFACCGLQCAPIVGFMTPMPAMTFTGGSSSGAPAAATIER